MCFFATFKKKKLNAWTASFINNPSHKSAHILFTQSLFDTNFWAWKKNNNKYTRKTKKPLNVHQETINEWFDSKYANSWNMKPNCNFHAFLFDHAWQTLIWLCLCSEPSVEPARPGHVLHCWFKEWRCKVSFYCYNGICFFHSCVRVVVAYANHSCVVVAYANYSCVIVAYATTVV